MKIKDIETNIKLLMRQWVEARQSQSPINKIRYAGPVLGPDEYEAMMTAIFDDWWSGGQHTIKAEKKLANISDRKYAVLTNSGSSANLVLLEAMKDRYFKDGDRILTLACGFSTTVSPIIKAGLTPVFVDIDLNTLNINPQAIVRAVKDLGIKGVFLPHTLGYKNDIEAIADIAKFSGLKVMYDACDAYGTVYQRKPIQHYGEAASLSFYVAHLITMGEGGAVVTDDSELYKAMRSIRSWGRYCSADTCCVRSIDPSAFCPTVRLTKDSPIPDDYPIGYIYEWLGYNVKPLELQSAVLSVQMDRIKEFSKVRVENYKRLQAYFEKSRMKFKLWDIDEDVSPFVYPVLIPDDAPFSRSEFVEYLKKNRVETRVIFGGNLTRHPAYYKNKNSYIVHGDLDNSNLIMEYGLTFGVSHVNDMATTDKMIDIIDTFLKRF